MKVKVKITMDGEEVKKALAEYVKAQGVDMKPADFTFMSEDDEEEAEYIDEDEFIVVGEMQVADVKTLKTKMKGKATVKETGRVNVMRADD